MRALPCLTALLPTILLLACDSKPAIPPAPKTDSPPAADAQHAPGKGVAPRDESPTQTGY